VSNGDARETTGDLIFVLEDESDRRVFGSYDGNQHCAIRGQSVAFESNRAGLRGGHFEDVVVPLPCS